MTLTLGFLLLLGLCRNTLSEGPAVPPRSPDRLEFELPATTYETEDSYSPGPIGALFQMVRVFLRLVQPNAFPEDILRKIVQRKFDFSADYEKPESVVLALKIIHYEVGFIICAALGLAFVILMPLVGSCFCLCRCYNKCGGEMHQREKRNGAFLRKAFGGSLLAICVLISAGIVWGFVANQHIRTHIDKTRKLADSNFRDLRTLLNGTSSQINYVLGQYTAAKEKALSDLDDIKSKLGGKIHKELRPRVIPVLDNIKDMAAAMKLTKEALVDMNQTLEELKSSTAQLNTNLQTIKENLRQLLSDTACSSPPGSATCSDIRMSLNQLDGNTNLGQLPSLKEQIDKIDDVLQTDLSSIVQESYKSFDDIPEMVQSQTTDVVSDIKRTLDSIGSNIKGINEKISIRRRLSRFLERIDSVEVSVHRRLFLLEEYDAYRWLGSLVVCFVLTLIVVFYYLGLLCGVLGYDRKATPTRRGCVSNTGGIFLMVAVGVSFLFCWILMIIVVLTFVIGGNLEKLVCEPYQNRKLFQILDTPYLLNEEWKYYLSGIVFNKPDINLTFEQVYSACKDNRGIYTAFKLENSYNVSEHLRIQEHTGSINSKFENMNVKVDNIVLLGPEGRRNLMDFSAAGVDKIDYDAYLAETAKTPTKGNLLTFADDLEEKASKLPPGNLQQSLSSNAEKLRVVYQNQVFPLESSMERLHQIILELQKKSSILGIKMTNIISSLDFAQDFITNNASSIIVQEIKKYGNIITGYFEHYLQWVKIAITERIAACKPMATALDSAVDVFLCNYVTKPMNLFWFGIGKATVFLLPALIFAVKLAKYYRRMDSEDVYQDLQKDNLGFPRDTATQPL